MTVDSSQLVDQAAQSSPPPLSQTAQMAPPWHNVLQPYTVAANTCRLQIVAQRGFRFAPSKQGRFLWSCSTYYAALHIIVLHHNVICTEATLPSIIVCPCPHTHADPIRWKCGPGLWFKQAGRLHPDLLQHKEGLPRQRCTAESAECADAHQSMWCSLDKNAQSTKLLIVLCRCAHARPYPAIFA